MYCALEGLSIGDSYGNHHGSNQRKHAAEIWNFTDDTLMALSVVDNLRKFGEIHQNDLARNFAERREGQRGYGQGVTRLLKAIKHGADWKVASKEMFEGGGSYGNGAAMRVAPVGAYFANDLDRVVEQARLSAEVTHGHIEGVAGAIAVAVAAALAWQYREQGFVPERVTFLNRVLPFIPESEVRQKTQIAIDLPSTTSFGTAAQHLGNGRPSIAQTTVPFSLWAASGCLSDYQVAIQSTAGVKGDVDTTSAIVGSIVVMYTGVEGIPQHWRDRREPFPRWPFEDETK
jgi:ADP-ribosylglycohydrolase